MSPESNPIDQALRLRPVAIVGASADRTKYGNIVLRDLRERGWTTHAINPRGGDIEGEPAYTQLQECPTRPELVVFVTSPPATLDLLDQVVALGVDHVWFQPGASSPEVLERAKALGLNTVDACIMVEAALRSA